MRLLYLEEMRRVYFMRFSKHLGFITGIKHQLLAQLVTCHVKMTVSLGPQGTFVTGTKTTPVTVIQYRRRVLLNCVSSVLMNEPTAGAHRSVLVTGFYATHYIVGMFVTGVRMKPVTHGSVFITSFN
jgi:hypothetical protein